MKSYKINIIFFCSLLALFILSYSQDSDKHDIKTTPAFLIASKILVNKYVAQDKDLIIVFNIYNIGDDAAYDITLKDKIFDADSFITEHGIADVKWDKINAKENVTHSIILKPKFAGNYNLTFAEISYLDSPNSVKHQSFYTSAPGVVHIIPLKEYQKLFSSHLLL
ncbi:translocon-associated protein subunit beta-like isoform X2 [Gordionus sp. m RMFG-2023]|uniref:translocon-associated protein subunit beta-like isoform X2 n=1 Tax=Gordionus sp. m RMFG-2023 TaxID=3053472 RepID=UPI0031FCC429